MSLFRGAALLDLARQGASSGSPVFLVAEGSAVNGTQQLRRHIPSPPKKQPRAHHGEPHMMYAFLN